MTIQLETQGRRRWGLTPAAALGAALFLSMPVYGQAQPAATPTHPIEVAVRNVEAEGQLIRVPVNKSVLVDFSVPVREVRLAKPEYAEASAITPKQILLSGKSFGTTQMIVWVDGDQQQIFDVAVDLDLERLTASIRTAVPRAQVNAEALLDAVVLTGRVPDASAAERVMAIAELFSTRIINQVQVAGTQQVLLRCTVAEVNRSAIRQLGFNGWLAGDDMRDMFFLSNLDGLNPANIGAPAGSLATADIPFVVGDQGIPVTGQTTLSFGFPRVQMQVFVQALREDGLLRVLAEPNLVAISGEEASFLAGGEVPVPIVTDERIKIDWKQYGVRLNFTPAVIAGDRIRLLVAPEISEADFANAITVSGNTVPSFNTRRVETVVEIGSGQTFAIGGLLNERARAVSRRVPGLGDIPVLGTLFRSVDFQLNESELVVLVTPELVEPVSPDQITYLPGESYVAPNDFELYLMGVLEGQSEHEVPALRPRVNQTWPVRPAELYGPAAAMQLRGPLGPTGAEEGS
jgi:pilus assembly protein CpaC